MSRKNITSPEVRKLIIEAYGRGDSRKVISENYNVKPTTVSMIIKTFKIHGMQQRVRGHRKQKLDDIHRQQISDWLQSDCQLTLSDIQDKLRENFNIGVGGEDGRSLVGSRANKKVQAVRGKSFSICAAISFETLYFYEAQETSYNIADFGNYLTQLFAHFERDQIRGAHLVMDNVRFHRNSGISELISQHGHNAIFLPPYSPFLNPIENMFNQLKYWIKRFNPSSADEVFEAIERASDVITENDIKNYVSHMEKYIPRCVSKEVIEN